MILTREEFADYFGKLIGYENVTDNNPIWIPELRERKQCAVFVSIPSLKYDQLETFRQWVRENCLGSVMCFSSSESTDWFGFTHEPDVVLWLLRWG